MPQIDISRHARTAACLGALLVSGAALGACGGSSTTTSTAASAPSAQANRKAIAALAAKLKASAARSGKAAKAGTTTTVKPSTPTSPSTLKLTPSSKGTSKAPTANSFAQTLSRFTVCLRRHGVKLSSPSGKGPILSTKGIDTHSPAFVAATTKCRQELLAALRPSTRPSKR